MLARDRLRRLISIDEALKFVLLEVLIRSGVEFVVGRPGAPGRPADDHRAADVARLPQDLNRRGRPVRRTARATRAGRLRLTVPLGAANTRPEYEDPSTKAATLIYSTGVKVARLRAAAARARGPLG